MQTLIKYRYKVLLLLAAVVVLYGCSPEQRFAALLRKHPGLITHSDTVKAYKRFSSPGEQKTGYYALPFLEYKPLRPGDSLVLRGKRFKTVIKRLHDSTQVKTTVLKSDTTVFYDKVINVFPDAWSDKYRKIHVRYLRLLSVTVALAAFVVLGLFWRFRRCLP